MTNKQIREWGKQLMVGEDLDCGGGWWLKRMGTGRTYFAYWFVMGQESDNTSKLGCLTDCLKHMGR